MHQLTVVARITAQPGKEGQTREALQAFVPTTLREEGCLNYDLHQSIEQPAEFLLYENWTDYDLWQQHMHNNHLKAFMEKANGLLAKPIDLSLWRRTLRGTVEVTEHNLLEKFAGREHFYRTFG